MSKNQGGFAGLLGDSTGDHSFLLDPAEITDTKEEIGKGTYGTVFKVKFQGSVRVAKEFYPSIAIKGKSVKEKKETVKKFRRCAELHHGNIVTVLGMYENKIVKPNTIVMVMEKMDCNLSSLLECGSEISNPTKLSILLDVSLGLKYLHTQSPPIVHYNLSSSNILLTAAQKAKISDVGVAQLITCSGEKKSPKALFFMAPELHKSNSGPPADVFSYGAVMLHVVTEQQQAIVSTNQTKQLQYYHKLHIDRIAADAFFKHLEELVKSCLDPDSKARPNIFLISQFIEIMSKVPTATESLVTNHDPSKVQKIPEQVVWIIICACCIHICMCSVTIYMYIVNIQMYIYCLSMYLCLMVPVIINKM